MMKTQNAPAFTVAVVGTVGVPARARFTPVLPPRAA